MSGAPFDTLKAAVDSGDWDRVEETFGELFPAFSQVEGKSDFDSQYAYPIFDAIHDGDDEKARELVDEVQELNDAELAFLASGWSPGHVHVVEEDAMYGDRYQGEFYEPSRPLSEVAKRIRHDIKGAVAAGYLPSEYTYSVRTSKGSVRLYVEGMADEDIYYRNTHSAYAGDRGFSTEHSWKAKRIKSRLETIGAAYASMKSNSQVDYFDNSHYTFAEIRTEGEVMFWEHEKELTKMKKAVKDATDPDEQVRLRAVLVARQRELDAIRRKKREEDREKWDW